MISIALVVLSALALETTAKNQFNDQSCYKMQGRDGEWNTVDDSGIGPENIEYQLFRLPRTYSAAQAYCISRGSELANFAQSSSFHYVSAWLVDPGLEVWLGYYYNATAGATVDKKWLTTGGDNSFSENYAIPWKSGAATDKEYMVHTADGWTSADGDSYKVFLCQKQKKYQCSKCKGRAIMAVYLEGNPHIPRCKGVEDAFSPAQCKKENASRWDCWCVQKDGRKIEGSDKTYAKDPSPTYAAMTKYCKGLRSTTPKTLCEKKLAEAKTKSAALVPTCKPNGLFGLRQCLNSFCFCSMPDGFIIPNTMHDEKKHTEDWCWKYRAYQADCKETIGNIPHSFDNTRFVKCGPSVGPRPFICSCPTQDSFFSKTKLVWDDKLKNCVWP